MTLCRHSEPKRALPEQIIWKYLVECARSTSCPEKWIVVHIFCLLSLLFAAAASNSVTMLGETPYYEDSENIPPSDAIYYFRKWNFHVLS